MELLNSASQVSTEQKWKNRVTEWESSGISQKKFCYEHGFNIHTFQYWRTRLNKIKPEDEPKQTPPIKIVEIKPDLMPPDKKPLLGSAPIILSVKSFKVEIQNNFCEDSLTRLIRVLRSV